MNTETLAQLDVIPLPATVEFKDGAFTLSTRTPIANDFTEAAPTADYLREQLSDRLGGDVTCGIIRFEQSIEDLGDEGYRLTIDGSAATLTASNAAGWFYAVQTLLRLIPHRSDDAASIPCLSIDDRPRFAWRGLMLDVVRHLMPVDGILRLLDNMAACKLNTFHWHLTDDQGWRIESKRYPKLTQIGAFRRGADGELTRGPTAPELPHVGTYGGFYTQDEVRRVVAHAQRLHITVVPEIEMPGHAIAALAAYPEFACTSGTFKTAVRTGIFKDVYCAGNDAALIFLQDILEEILPLFPSTFIHVGGDECPKDRWKTCFKCQARIAAENLGDEHGLQSYVIRRMATFLASRGRRLIGWDEILEGGLPPGATVMSWRGTEGGIAAAQAGHDVVMTPHTHCYLDYRQAADGEPFAIGNVVTTLEKLYDYEPVPAELTPRQASHILGMQGNIWTEYMPDMQHVEYMIWPRAAAIAETSWAAADAKDFADFRRRVIAAEPRLAASGSAYRRTEHEG